MYEVKSAYEPNGPSGRPLSPVSVLMKQLGVFVLPSGKDASPSQRYPQHEFRQHPFMHLGGERGTVRVTHHNVPA